MNSRSSLLPTLAIQLPAAWFPLVLSASLFLPHPTSAQELQIRLTDVSAQAAVDFEHTDGGSGMHYLVEAISGSLASFDFDNDGRVDVYFLNGAALRGTTYDTPPINQLHRNRGDFQFENVSKASGLADLAYSLGVTVGDYDNDGFDDVYVTNMGPNTFYRNNGDGTFQSVNGDAVACGDKVGAGASMLDIDADGNLDIYASSYIRFDYDIPPSEFRGRIVYGGPLLYPKETDNLLRNDGIGSFLDISQQAGIADEKEWGMGTIAVDFDKDGDTDIFVANDSTKNSLWLNDGKGVFTECALLMGIAYDFQGDPQGSMGVDIGDIDQDGWLDLFQTAYTKQLATLYRNEEGAFFSDSTRSTGVGQGTFHPVNWGTALCDLDNDGDRDVFMANGHIHDNMDDVNTATYRCRNFVFENQDGAFRDVTQLVGTGTEPVESSRGCVADDLDNDGRVDLIVMNSRRPPTVIRNESESRNNWIQLQLIGLKCNRSAVGSQVRVTTDAGSQLLEVHSGRGYQGHFGSTLHFGLGEHEKIKSIEIHWHGGRSQTIRPSEEKMSVNACYILRQGEAPVKDQSH